MRALCAPLTLLPRVFGSQGKQPCLRSGYCAWELTGAPETTPKPATKERAAGSARVRRWGPVIPRQLPVPQPRALSFLPLSNPRPCLPRSLSPK